MTSDPGGPATPTSDTPTKDSDDFGEEWVTIRLTRDEAKSYLEAEIVDWFKERDIDILAPKAPEQHARRPWYFGYFDGVRIDKAICYYIEFMRERFRTNPYGLSAKVYVLIIFAYIFFAIGSLLLGYFEGIREKSILPLLRGALTAIPIIWMFPLFVWPPLIANVQDQFAAYGHDM